MAHNNRIIIALLAFGAGCTAERPGVDKPDAAVMADELEAPTLEATPATTPNDTIAVRGTTNGARVVIKGGPGDPIVRSVLPSGGFCGDIPLLPTGPTSLLVFALKDGSISPATTVTVTKDPGAPIPSSPQCLGMEEPTCVPEEAALCTNDKDDNCNGFIDECDPTCNGCVDDGFGPNWAPFFVPMVAVGSYNLEMCPCRADYFAFTVLRNETIHVKATFVSTVIDLDMRLQIPKAAEDNTNISVASSATTTGIEEITYVATAAGTYYLKIYPYSMAKQDGAYRLTIY